MFTDTQYEFSITENALAGVLTGTTINTTDADGTAENRVVTYRITDQGNVDWFGIEESTVSL